MTTTMQQKQNNTVRRFLSNWGVHLLILVAMLVVFYITATLAAAEAEANALAAGEESTFTLRNVYSTWAWILLGGMFVQSVYFGFRQGWAFASIIQVSLIVLITITFMLIMQEVDRNVYRVGVLGLIMLTLVQVAFGNIPPQANFRLSMIGLAITAIIITSLVFFSIWLVPYLIQLGR